MEIKEQKGFSLVELMIVIAILAILAAVAVPSFQRFAINSDLKTAARDIQGDFFICKERAIAENQQYQITFKTGDNEYTIEQPPGTTIRTKKLADFKYRGEVKLDSAAPTGYTFQPRGTVTVGTIVLKNNITSTATITANITGKTYVQFNLQ